MLLCWAAVWCVLLGSCRKLDKYSTSQICKGLLQHYCLSTIPGLSDLLHISQQMVVFSKSQVLNQSLEIMLGPNGYWKKSETMSQACQVSKTWNQTNPEKQSEKSLSSWHVRRNSPNTWRSVMWSFRGYRRVAWCVHFHFVCLPFTLPSKILEVLESPCSDVAILL